MAKTPEIEPDAPTKLDKLVLGDKDSMKEKNKPEPIPESK